MMQYLDVTYLDAQTDIATLTNLCEKIKRTPVKPASVCVFLRDLLFVKQLLSTQNVKFCVPINFPTGDESHPEIFSQLNSAKQSGAHEVDVVIPYQIFLRDKNFQAVGDFIEMIRSDTTQTLKVILETGELAIDDVYKLSQIACSKNVDFIKTSTGKVKVGATELAVKAVMQAIKEYSHKKVGLKVSGGVRTVEQAQRYVDLVKENLGDEWLNPAFFRIGASSLFDELRTINE